MKTMVCMVICETWNETAGISTAFVSVSWIPRGSKVWIETTALYFCNKYVWIKF